MKIVHLYAQNIQAFADAVKGTECRLNASRDINYLLNSLHNYNARDVMGLIVFANPMTKRSLRLIEKFDNLFTYQSLPIIVINDNATQLRQSGYFKVVNSDLYLIDSEENSISDVEINAIFTTLLASTDELYDLSGCDAERESHKEEPSKFEEGVQMSDSLRDLLETLKGSVD